MAKQGSHSAASAPAGLSGAEGDDGSAGASSRISSSSSASPSSETHGPEADIGAVVRRTSDQLTQLLSRDQAPGLYLVATPIGNLSDITLRALTTLASADVIYAEDTRHSARLLGHYAIKRPVRSYHDHSGDVRRKAIVAAVEGGQSVALISDAGTPLISDPGLKLVRAVIAAGGAVFSIPGPSAVLAALTTSGLASESFLFAGFLPAKTQQRRKRLADLLDTPSTVVIYEAPQRVSATVGDVANIDPKREIAIGRELTKQYEEIIRGTAMDVGQSLADRSIKGECVIVVAPAARAPAVTDEEIGERLDQLLRDHSVRDAARLLADELTLPKGRVYQLALERSRRG